MHHRTTVRRADHIGGIVSGRLGDRTVRERAEVTSLSRKTSASVDAFHFHFILRDSCNTATPAPCGP